MNLGALVPRWGTVPAFRAPVGAPMMRRRVVCPRSHPASLYLSPDPSRTQRVPRSGARAWALAAYRPTPAAS
jgi:hypothetical protein